MIVFRLLRILGLSFFLTGFAIGLFIGNFGLAHFINLLAYIGMSLICALLAWSIGYTVRSVTHYYHGRKRLDMMNLLYVPLTFLISMEMSRFFLRQLSAGSIELGRTPSGAEDFLHGFIPIACGLIALLAYRLQAIQLINQRRFF